MTCSEPLPLGSFRRHNDETRTRHDSCTECEDKAKALKALKRSRATVNKDRYNAARYAARAGKAVGPVEIKTRWVGVNAGAEPREASASGNLLGHNTKDYEC
jgi:hypothetical protein